MNEVVLKLRANPKIVKNADTIMEEFFQVTDLEAVFGYIPHFQRLDTESVSLTESGGRILAKDLYCETDLPDFARSTMDGYAVKGRSTFGASDANPAFVTIKGEVPMGQVPDFSVGMGEAGRISTGGMLPQGADSVVMREHARPVDDTLVEVYRSVAPGQHVVAVGEDFANGELVIPRQRQIRPQEAGLMAALGRTAVEVYCQPTVGIISTGDEVVPITATPGPGQIRDINSYTLAGLIEGAGGIPKQYGLVVDDPEALYTTCLRALEETDMVLVSGGSSVGNRDYTIDVFSRLPEAEILVHGISISPGKPTILGRSESKAIWGLPGHVVSAMVVFSQVVQPFIRHLAGLAPEQNTRIHPTARLTRNVASVLGRIDFIRVRLIEKEGRRLAEPVLGKSGLINTMVKADGLIRVDQHREGLDAGTLVEVIPV